jgi:hypothetical protein
MTASNYTPPIRLAMRERERRRERALMHAQAMQRNRETNVEAEN